MLLESEEASLQDKMPANAHALILQSLASHHNQMATSSGNIVSNQQVSGLLSQSLMLFYETTPHDSTQDSSRHPLLPLSSHTSDTLFTHLPNPALKPLPPPLQHRRGQGSRLPVPKQPSLRNQPQTSTTLPSFQPHPFSSHTQSTMTKLPPLKDKAHYKR